MGRQSKASGSGERGASLSPQGSSKGFSVNEPAKASAEGDNKTAQAPQSRFGAPSLRNAKTATASRQARGGNGSNAKAIPDAVAQRMARRIAVATGIPSLLGMGVFVGSYVLITRGIADIPTGVTLIASGGCFLLGLLGLSYGVLSASWEEQPGSLLGSEQIGVNIGRLRQSIRAMRQGSQ